MMHANTQDQAGRTFLITGANAGIGRATAQALCARGARVHLACRSQQKTRPLLEELWQRHGTHAAAFLELDLADLDSVRAAAARYLASGEPLSVLINNAGLAGTRGQATKQGFEMTMGTNHLGHFLLTQLLLERLKESRARIVFVSSKSHEGARTIPFARLREPTRTRTGLREYQWSKLANVLCANELARKLAGTGVTTYSLHPGVVRSDIWRRLPTLVRDAMYVVRGMITSEEGARTTLHCATSADVAMHTGRYYAKESEVKASAAAGNEALARALWDWSEGAVTSR